MRMREIHLKPTHIWRRLHCKSLRKGCHQRNSRNPAQIDVQKEISKGDLLSGPGEDLLTMAIGPEHPRRTRAVGHDIGLRKGMQ
ncbi:unnamed protein product [Lactuca virosa]|uniref:Uncharacterized protein n=1 Tax=Lactuca virosa TaxID=75947 RepID=A0AAU9M110_9ASTR|nr:unnamed protein product [Lactuca virosa]